MNKSPGCTSESLCVIPVITILESSSSPIEDVAPTKWATLDRASENSLNGRISVALHSLGLPLELSLHAF